MCPPRDSPLPLVPLLHGGGTFLQVRTTLAEMRRLARAGLRFYTLCTLELLQNDNLVC